MSVSDKEISSVGISGGGGEGGGGCGGNDGDEDDDESGCVCGVHANEDRRTKQRGYGFGGFGRNLGKAKQVVLNPFTKARKHLSIRKQKRAFLPSSSSSAAQNAVASSGNGIGGDGGSGGKGCYFCFKRPLTLESPIGSRTSDPNDPDFTYDMLKVLIEQSDFYSRECNPHLDIDSIAD
ncbi:uncharacterized protein LOC107411683 [Ziziphus jujuba]|uniref:Uncharacterized protein LOC107411683 n=1 Tax=Ziziphus jujuba TaxID=326968 RepID=A0A6P6FW55_ZIZJJ|nr:uncharacterized protein LOC107411683 [Ziziphus jujuba]XP_024926257.2 uncharacterized protein LOC107411683 [Ziziphus jujuba]XP_024926258.2 uncharacterized protein LOC107411683 [Ziziphus jujuba]